jgi:hypothetical protein
MSRRTRSRSALRGWLAPRARALLGSLPVWLLVSLLVSLGAACDDGVTPRLSDFRYDGAAPDSATVLLLTVGFTDGDGDLAGGTLETFIDDDPTGAGALPLLPIFIASELAPTATEGFLFFVLELALGENPPAPGSSFRLGVRVTDDAGHTSPTEAIGLTIDY